ncbi:tRNA (adenosine(37)-N6)-threonylcarbamoyltransferase complex transferase subunit TsaD, partial [Ornithobacterium rhinotracheale]
IALAGGVSANSELRKKIKNLEKLGFTTYIPKFEYTTDNAAMIAMVGSIKYQAQSFSDVSAKTIARYKL